MGALFHMVDPVLSIAAALSVQSPFTMRAHSDSACIAARNDSESEHGNDLLLNKVREGNPIAKSLYPFILFY